MLDDFLVRALLAGVGVALVAGPIGCFVVWRRMAYFGTTLAHGALLGVALGLLVELHPMIGVVLVSMAIAVALVALQSQRRLASDTLLGILAHAALAAALVLLSFLEGVRVDLMAYLFGDILAVAPADLVWIWLGGGTSLVALMLLWRSLLAMTVHEDLALIEGVPVARVRFLFMLLIAVVIAVAMKIVGVLLIVSMLIVPAAAARLLARTPEQMAALAAAIGVVGVMAGLAASLHWDTPAGPSVVSALTLVFLGMTVLGRRSYL